MKKLFSEIYVKKYLPLIRKEISVNLSEKGYKQKEIAELLNIDQTTVSNYLKQVHSQTTTHFSTKTKIFLNKKTKELIFKDSENRLEIFKEILEHFKNELKKEKYIYFDI